MGEFDLLLTVDGDISTNSPDHCSKSTINQTALLRNRPRSASTASDSNGSAQYQSRVMIYKIGVCAAFWYVFSFSTLFLNKYILSSLDGDPTVLSTFQMSMCALVGFFHVKVPLGLQSVGHIVNPKRYMYDLQTRSQIRISNFSKSLLVVGCLRCCTIMFSLIALWYVPVSFAETVKSSAPVFTVVIARLLLNERTKMLVSLSLVPTMVGLALCSAYELDITATGLTASLCAVLFECFQNVCSKRLLSKERIAPHLLQFYTSAAAFVLQLPSFLLLVHFSSLYESIRQDHNLLLAYVLAGISFHLQSLSEYLLLSHISPVTHSVANTAKRALLIWLSVLAFGNQVTPLSWLGTSLVIIGVLMYNKAKTVSEQSQLDDTINSKQRSHLV